MKLNTLKDLDFMNMASGDYGCACFADEDEIKKELKQEAIKWIKELERCIEEHVGRDEICDYNTKELGISLWGIPYEQDDIPPVIDFIKHFFNITEEDLNGVDEE